MVVAEVVTMTQEQEIVDVVVVGGGAAGLSAALVLGRARRSVLVVDAGSPRNAPAEGVHGFLTRDGISPAELVAVGRKEVEQYGGRILSGEAVAASRAPDGFEVTLADGGVVAARRLILTIGQVDELPDIPGLRQRWGRDVLHCPYCHGWEVRDQPIGVLGVGAWSVHQALLFRQWSPDVMLFTHTMPALTDEQTEQLAARDIRVVTGPVDSLVVAEDRLTGVRMSDGRVIARRAVTVMSRPVLSTVLLDGLGLTAAAHPSGLAEHVPADPTGRTEVPGVWVAGNVTEPMAQVVLAAAAGVTAAAQINADLIHEETERAVADRRRTIGQMFTRDFWDERYASAHRIWSGNPNPHLVATATDLTPGSALDVGCGEGADAIWLAGNGWRVTGVDVSAVALERAARHAAETGADLADRITWQPADVLTWEPAAERYDLVSAQFVHLPRPGLDALHRRLAAAVRPGGTLLVVGHHPSDLETSLGRPNLPELMFTAERVAAGLDPDQWEIVVADAPQRQTRDPEGRTITIRDAVLRAVRRR
nr:bifunctional NAD(P)/FAD-dependent oxidoreductase/class I SAM-dependent methyltransferase [Micromonospora sp. DSM 115978]